VSQSNVVPFDPSRRGGLARRGAPDKTGAPADAFVWMECPGCASELRVAAEREGLDEVFCGRCDVQVALDCPTATVARGAGSLPK
jgi:hypothetical protein